MTSINYLIFSQLADRNDTLKMQYLTKHKIHYVANERINHLTDLLMRVVPNGELQGAPS